MDIVLWVLQGLLAAAMLMAGGMKLAKGNEGLLEEPRMAWVGDFSDSTIRSIGLLEVAAAVGLILPWWLDIAPILTPLAAVGVVAIMLGAMFTHRRRGEIQMIVGNVMLSVSGSHRHRSFRRSLATLAGGSRLVLDDPGERLRRTTTWNSDSRAHP